jgi:integrase
VVFFIAGYAFKATLSHPYQPRKHKYQLEQRLVGCVCGMMTSLMAHEKFIPSTGNWQFTIKRAGLLPKPLYLTFNDKAAGLAYCQRIEALLDKGIVPSEYQTQIKAMSMVDLVREYESNAHPSQKDKSAIGTLLLRWGKTPLTAFNVRWVDAWIDEMKRVDKISPDTIRSKVGALARCTDWGVRKGLLVMPDHPFRTLPDGYSQYTVQDKALAGVAREDIERDRRLEDGEYEKILTIIDGGVLPRKQRPYSIEYVAATRTLFILAVESAMRLQEMYTLTLDQVKFSKRTVFLEKTKNGDKRQVPLSTVAMSTLKDYLKVRVLPEGSKEDALFPWWNGTMTPLYLRVMSAEMSKLFCNTRSPGIFKAASCLDLKFHDLRHEATCRLFERTTLSDAEIMKITGHKSMKMLLRYANLRGSSLAQKMW